MDVYTDTVEQYRDFAGHAAAGYSPCFEEWASRVAEDAEVLGWLEELPRPKRQPNLVFAAARWHGVAAPGPYDALRRALLDDQGEIRRTIMERATQTNEAGRLATLVPAFVEAAGPGPLALLEVGASAGLCLYPDRYTYAWTTADGVRRIGAGPELAARVEGPAPLPAAPPVVAWRGGIDLNPLDVTQHRPDGLADDPGLAGARRPPGPAGPRDRRGPRRSAVAGPGQPARGAAGPGRAGPPSTGRWSSSTAR